MSASPLTDIGPWSEVKIDIVRRYAKAYSDIMKSQKWLRDYAYVDGFAGAGKHISRKTRLEVDGSPAAVLRVDPPFPTYHFVELDAERAGLLHSLDSIRPGRVTIHDGDANDKLLNEILPLFSYESRRRALLLLDPYNIGIDWRVTELAGKLRTIDLFLNFMVMDANMNVLRLDPGSVRADQAARMDIFWGDGTWRETMYQPAPDVLPGFEIVEKQSNEVLAKAFAGRLKSEAGFKYVAEPLPVKNDTGQVVYYLFFASQNETALRIANSIFKARR